MGKIKVFRRNNVKVANRKRRLKIAFRSFWLTLILMLVFLGLRQLGMHLDSLRVNQIQVTGVVSPLNSEKVISMAGVQVGMPIFGINLNEVIRRLQENPWIDKVKLSRRLPHTFLIEVTPHQAKMILSLGQFYYLGARGEIFKELKDKSDSWDLPYFTGFSRAEIEQDPPRAREMFDQALKLLAEYESLPLSKDLGLSEIHYDRVLGFSLYPEKTKMRVLIGFDDFQNKFKRLSLAYEKLKETNKSFASIDLNYEGKVIFTM